MSLRKRSALRLRFGTATIPRLRRFPPCRVHGPASFSTNRSERLRPARQQSSTTAKKLSAVVGLCEDSARGDKYMSTAAIETVTKMLESFPESVQDQAAEHLREYLEEITDDLRWDESFKRTSEKLAEAARFAREQSENGMTEPFDLERL